ncbi:MAG TPA: hypothetical protein EYF98_01565 [Planctomycetes bacterium]|nr:hypothetical protein [Planctomycetota bacterium]
MSLLIKLRLPSAEAGSSSTPRASTTVAITPVRPTDRLDQLGVKALSSGVPESQRLQALGLPKLNVEGSSPFDRSTL